MLSTLRFYDVVLFIHITAVVIGFGIVFTYPIWNGVLRAVDPRSLPAMHALQTKVGGRFIAPFGGIILLAGIYLAVDGPYEGWWIGFGGLAILVELALGGAFFTPTERRLEELARRDVAAAGPDGQVTMSEEYEVLLARWNRVGAFAGLLVLVTIFLMVWKPGG